MPADYDNIPILKIGNILSRYAAQYLWGTADTAKEAIQKVDELLLFFHREEERKTFHEQLKEAVR